MTAREYLSQYQFDRRIINGSYFSADPLPVEKGDTIGIVLMNLGGPEVRDDVAPFLYNLFMDPAIIDLPVGGIFRHWLSKFISKTRSRSVGEDYEAIGGGSPINRLTREQARTLERLLNRHHAKSLGLCFRTYIAMRYWKPSSEDAARQMHEDGVDKVLLLPLYPQYSKTTTGASLAYWHALEKTGEIPTWPSTFVYEYAANPKYIQALSERIDEGLQRFPKEVRSDVQLLFSAHGTPVREMRERRDPYCCLIHSTVDRVMKHRGPDRPFHVAFQSKVGPAEWLTPSTPDKLEGLAEEGHRSVLVVPVAFVTDHIETSFELDIEYREEAEQFGIEHYEVTSGLNSHPLFIEALAEATLAQLALPDDRQPIGLSGDGAPSKRTYPLCPLKDMPRFSATDRTVRCHQCECITEARCWDAPRLETRSEPSRRKAS